MNKSFKKMIKREIEKIILSKINNLRIERGEKITLKSSILRHLKEFKSITSFEAFEEYGTTRLSAFIFELRKSHNIADEVVEKTNRFGQKIRFKKYLYIGEK